ncbi:MAG: transcription antitermination factor NusB [Acidobacteriaceae bacterium]|nr:transcription antitermination factor NusB [Acidobacteriaceae bacterium]
MSPARWAAFRVLERVAETDAHSDDLLHGALLAGLSQADAGLAHALVLGVLRRQLELEARLLPLLSRPDAPIPGPVATALRMGAFQLLYMDRIPAHAALSESVELVKLAGHPKAAGMVNALLRKISLAGKGSIRRPLVESPQAMAGRLGHPEWLVKRWLAIYGREVTEAICNFDLEEPAGAGLFSDGRFAMDDGSRLVAELAAAALPQAKRVWDTCAAPGGKTLVLADHLPEAEIIATDVSPKRVERLRERTEREAPGRVRVLQADAANFSSAEGRFDLILCDAPCSGTGTLAHNPEIKVRLEPEDLRRQSDRQRKILKASLERLAPGGRLVYSTCSLEPEENERIVATLGTLVKIIPMEETLGLLQLPFSGEAPLQGPYLRTLPGANFAGDGFFAAILERA